MHLVYAGYKASVARELVSGYLVEQSSKIGLIEKIRNIFAVTEFVRIRYYDPKLRSLTATYSGLWKICTHV